MKERRTGHNMVQVVPGLLLLAAALGFPASDVGLLHFGCNTSGPENASQLAQLARYTMPILEFRHEMSAAGSHWDHEEKVRALRDHRHPVHLWPAPLSPQPLPLPQHHATPSLCDPRLCRRRQSHYRSTIATPCLCDPSLCRRCHSRHRSTTRRRAFVTHISVAAGTPATAAAACRQAAHSTGVK